MCVVSVFRLKVGVRLLSGIELVKICVIVRMDFLEALEMALRLVLSTHLGVLFVLVLLRVCA